MWHVFKVWHLSWKTFEDLKLHLHTQKQIPVNMQNFAMHFCEKWISSTIECNPPCGIAFHWSEISRDMNSPLYEPAGQTKCEGCRFKMHLAQTMYHISDKILWSLLAAQFSFFESQKRKVLNTMKNNVCKKLMS